MPSTFTRQDAERVLPGGRDRRLGREVDDGVGAADGRLQRVRVEDVALERDERLAELRAQVPADEPRRPGDENRPPQ